MLKKYSLLNMVSMLITYIFSSGFSISIFQFLLLWGVILFVISVIYRVLKHASYDAGEVLIIIFLIVLNPYEKHINENENVSIKKANIYICSLRETVNSNNNKETYVGILNGFVKSSKDGLWVDIKLFTYTFAEYLNG